jgi:hypothetical protein
VPKRPDGKRRGAATTVRLPGSRGLPRVRSRPRRGRGA